MSPRTGKKHKKLDRIAEENGVAVVVLDEKSNEISVSNNNSICAALTASPDFRPKCAEFCGMAFQNTGSGEPFEYTCYAGLTCKAVPVADRGKRFVAIIGRAFTEAERYRQATERAISGDWAEFQPNEFFGNVLIAGSASNIGKAAGELLKFQAKPADEVLELDRQSKGESEKVVELKTETRPARTTGSAAPEAEKTTKQETPTPPATKSVAPGKVVDIRKETPPAQTTRPVATKSEEKFNAPTAAQRTPAPGSRPENRNTEMAVESKRPQDPRAKGRNAEASALRSLYGTLAKLPYEDACSSALAFIESRFGFKSLVWLERKDNKFLPVAATGSLREIPIKIGIPADNQRLVDASNQERPLELRERMIADGERPARLLNLFASVVGGEIRGAIGVEGPIEESRSRDVALFCRRIGPQLEILRLRREVLDREWLNRAVTRFNESLKRIDAEDFWTHVTQVSAELIQSERASLLLRNDQTQGLLTKAAVGARVNLFTEPGIGERVSSLVLEDGNPVVVEDITRIGVKAAPSSWNYKTHSFLSYPILIGERRIGVMNFTDKATGEAFDERDLELLEAIAPQIAVAIDRTVLKDKAGEFEQLSVTDPLTGLLNRRYLEKRLIEEIQRSKRHRFPMSLMMLDVDQFKSYNDTFGHPAGDTALKIVASILQDILRGDDVAARYGGEEFAILLPQTTSTEAAAIAERLRQRIERTEFPKRKVTVSIGIASCSNEIDTPDDLIGAADHALYEAKNQGRNNVRIYDGFGKSFSEKIH
jgi:diguanylate cyclase (GGDEF)-like protein